MDPLEVIAGPPVPHVDGAVVRCRETAGCEQARPPPPKRNNRVRDVPLNKTAKEESSVDLNSKRRITCNFLTAQNRLSSIYKSLK